MIDTNKAVKNESIIPTANNFDFLRVVLAATVFFAHARDLSNSGQIRSLTFLFNSEVAVKAFFGISGFLIFWSYERSKVLKEYFLKRIKRIYPAYFVSVMIFALTLFLISDLSIYEYFFTKKFFRYLVYNLTFLNFIQPTLPGIFVNNPVPPVNGALWTIKLEVMFYALVPLLAYLFKDKESRVFRILILYMTSYFYTIGFELVGNLTEKNIFYELSRQIPGQLSYFLGGILLFYYFDKFIQIPKWFFLIYLLTFYLSSQISFLSILRPISLSCIIMFLAFNFKYFNGFGKYGDFSYGIYVFHHPIIQIFVYFGYFEQNPYLALFLSLCGVVLIAILSWNFIEKPFLKRSIRSNSRASINLLYKV